MKEKFIYDIFLFSSRETIFSTISRITARTEKIQKNSSKKYAQDKEWIEKNLREGKWEQIRDISKKLSPAKNVEPETAMSPKRPLEDDLGKGKRIKIPNSKYNNDLENVYVVPTALNFHDLGLDDVDNDDKNFELGEKKPKSAPKKKKKSLQQTILAGERCGLNDFQIAMMYSAGSM